jgi:hypothetical protein
LSHFRPYRVILGVERAAVSCAERKPEIRRYRKEMVVMPRRDPGPSVKDKKLYERLRDEGDSKEKAARIANAAAKSSRSAVGRKGGRAGDYEEMSRDELYQRARRIGIEGRSRMTKAELIEALRHH